MRKLTIEDIYDLFEEFYYDTDNLPEEEKKNLFIYQLTHGNRDAQYHAENIWFCLVELDTMKMTEGESKACVKIIEYSISEINKIFFQSSQTFVEMINEERDRGTSNSINL